MSVYIRGMEMPKSCAVCDFCTGGLDCWISKENVCRDVRKEQRSNACPLFPIPPHGRLIDADALMERFSYSPGDTAEDRIWIRAARRIIIEEPTIIPASPADKEET